MQSSNWTLYNGSTFVLPKWNINTGVWILFTFPLLPVHNPLFWVFSKTQVQFTPTSPSLIPPQKNQQQNKTKWEKTKQKTSKLKIFLKFLLRPCLPVSKMSNIQVLHKNNTIVDPEIQLFFLVWKKYSLIFFNISRKFARKSKSKGRILEGLRAFFVYYTSEI